MPVALERAAEARHLLGRERQHRAEQRGLVERLRILDEMDAIHQQRGERLRHHHLAMGADDERVMRPERRCEALPKRRRVHVPGVAMDGNAALPADGVVLDRPQRHTLDQAEARGQVVVEVCNRVHVRPRLVELGVDEHLGWRLAARGISDLAPIHVAEKHVLGAQPGAALVERLDQDRVAIRKPRTDVAAITENLFVVEQQRHRRDLVAQPLLRIVLDRTMHDCT